MRPFIGCGAGYRRRQLHPFFLVIAFMPGIVGAVYHRIVHTVGMRGSGHQHHVREGNRHTLSKVYYIVIAKLILQIPEAVRIAVKQQCRALFGTQLSVPGTTACRENGRQHTGIDEPVGVHQKQGTAVRCAVECLAGRAVRFCVIQSKPHLPHAAVSGIHHCSGSISMVCALGNHSVHAVDIHFQVAEGIPSLNGHFHSIPHLDAAIVHRIAGHGNAFNQVAGFIPGAPHPDFRDLQEILYGTGQYIRIFRGLLEHQETILLVMVLFRHVHGLVSLLISGLGHGKLLPVDPVVGAEYLYACQTVRESGSGLESEFIYGYLVIDSEVHDGALVFHQPIAYESTRFRIQPCRSVSVTKRGLVPHIHLAEIQ